MTPEKMAAAGREALIDVLDPETGISVVHLGLIYDVTWDDAARAFTVLMTFTTPACPAGDLMADGVERRLQMLDGVEKAEVKVTFHPRWTPELVTPEGKAALGWA